MRTARNASSMRPIRPPNLLEGLHRATACCRAAGASARDFGESRHDLRGICWIAPNAAPKLHANMIVVTMVVRAELRARTARAMLGRLSVPAAFFSRQTGDSGRNGRTMISGIAGMTPDISV